MVYRVAQDLPKGFAGNKRAKRKWGQTHTRFCCAKVRRKVGSQGLWVKDDSSGKEKFLTVSEVANRLVRWAEVYPSVN